MKKWLTSIMMSLVLLLSACGNASVPTENAAGGNAAKQEATTEAKPEAEAKPETITYQSENGPIEVPASPKRIVGLTNAPNVLALGGTLVGVDEWTKKNPLFADKVKDVETVSDETMEKFSPSSPT